MGYWSERGYGAATIAAGVPRFDPEAQLALEALDGLPYDLLHPTVAALAGA